MEESVCKQEIGEDLDIVAFHLLVKPVVESHKSGLITGTTAEGEQARSFSVAQVLCVGNGAFVDKNHDRKCEPGEYIIYNKMRRENFVVVDKRNPSKKHQLFFINDDEVRGKVTKEYAEYQASFS